MCTPDRSIADILKTIDITLTTTEDGRSILLDTVEGEVIAVYGPEDHDAAERHYASLLTAEQLEALTLDAELTYELQCEERGNRELSW